MQRSATSKDATVATYIESFLKAKQHEAGARSISAARLYALRLHLGSTTDLRANGDNTGASAGKIDQADFNVWKANFGNHAGSGASAGSNAAVPEPTTLVMLILAAGGWCLRRRWTA